MPEQLLIGTYTSGRSSKGLYRAEVDADGSLRITGCLPMPDPSFVARHPTLPIGYVVGERPDRPGTITRIASDGTEAFETAPLGGHLPCHGSVSIDGRELWVACYGSAQVGVVPLAADGAFAGAPRFLRHSGRSTHPKRQTEPHPHCTAMHPNGRDVYVTDLGTDRIEHYRRDSGGAIERRAGCTVTPGAGPRHLAITPDGRRAVLANELDNTLDVFEIDLDGRLEARERIATLPADYPGRSFASEVALSEHGTVAWVGNRGHDSIARIPLDAPYEARWLPALGRHPRHFAVSTDGRRLAIANRDSDNVVVYTLDDGRATSSPVPAPAFVMWLQD